MALVVGLVVGTALHAVVEAFETYRGLALIFSITTGGVIYLLMRAIHGGVHVATGIAFLFFSFLHTLVDGVNLGAALSVSALLAAGNLLGLLLHEVMRWVASATFLEKIGWSRRKAWMVTVGLAAGTIALAATLAQDVVARIPYRELVAAAAAGGTVALVVPHVAPQMWTLDMRRRSRVFSVSLALIFAAGAYQAAELSHVHNHDNHDHEHHDGDDHHDDHEETELSS